ncbi:MAG: acetyl-CoA carboxylase biotin carboxyl carrier protein [Ruminococcaceae bacterium]|jgi:acetyl-CoA carboxylase biotin carboxyl carrier protein|nr:acetyl-CoA carboxylase biotin carboxyl carrier protein [Oscillospiraceae bacterium]HHV31842.1 acetyl-CoA carboxylase biotin carboxyl carrier protein [Clostridiales bacterium]
MNLKAVRSLIQVMNEGGLTCVEVTEGETKIRLEKQTAAAAAVSAVPAAVPTAISECVDQPAAPVSAYREVKSPMVGVFYAAPSPESEPYVQVGSKVSKGDVLCVIEAMKLLNELNADTDGEIVEICAQNGQVVEYGQTLFKLR